MYQVISEGSGLIVVVWVTMCRDYTSVQDSQNEYCHMSGVLKMSKV